MAVFRDRQMSDMICIGKLTYRQYTAGRVESLCCLLPFSPSTLVFLFLQSKFMNMVIDWLSRSSPSISCVYAYVVTQTQSYCVKVCFLFTIAHSLFAG